MKFSIIMMAFNQCQYISQAIESVVSQKLPENWELLIGDDCSSDQTMEIVNKWQMKFPNNIKYFRHKKNIGLHRNYEFLTKRSKGEFIALLEADDYWIHPEKSIRQIEFLENHPNVSWCFTNGRTIDENGNLLSHVILNLPSVFDLEFFLSNFFNPLNNSIVFRRSSEPEDYPEFFFKVKQWDTVLHYFRSLKGDIGFVPVSGLAWRRHNNATSFSPGFSGPSRYYDWITINEELKKIVPFEFKKYFNKNYVAFEFLSLSYLKQRKYSKFIKYLIKMLLNKPFRSIQFYRDYFWKLRNN